MDDIFSEDGLPFHYQGGTKGHSLNMVATEPAVIKKLKEHCVKVKGEPIIIHNAQYDFKSHNGKPATVYSVDIEVEEVEGKLSKLQIEKRVDLWAKKRKFPWSFGMPSEDEREV